MRARLALAVVLAATASAAPAYADDLASDRLGGAVPATVLDGQRGGADLGTTIAGNVLQRNATNEDSVNVGSISVSHDAAKLSGTIYSATVAGNQGMTTLMQNTGDMVNFDNVVNVIVYLK